jgi:hypothetical protein
MPFDVQEFLFYLFKKKTRLALFYVSNSWAEATFLPQPPE